MKAGGGFLWVRIALSVVIVAAVFCWLSPRTAPRWLRSEAVAAEAGDQGFSYDNYAIVLKTYVDDEDMVDYRGLKAQSDRLHAFVDALARLDSKVFDSWNEREKIAFWINVYNAVTLQVIIEHYPIKSSFPASLRYPKDSIRQISGVWDKIEFPVMGRKMTLDFVEHGILRKFFNEPRIHMALVCAALGCPPLRDEPFTGARLDEQLDDQTRRFLGNPDEFRIDRNDGRIYLSPIFKWFGKDFVKTYGTDEKFAGHSETERAVLNFVSKYLGDEEVNYLEADRHTLEHLDYDWSLNEQEEK